MIRSEQTHLPVVALTHPGMTGKNNEDRYVVTAFRLGAPGARGTRNTSVPALLAVLSDGIGGHRAGEVAAEIAVNAINQRVSESSAQDDPVAVLESAVQLASRLIYDRSQEDLQERGMGATCAAAWIIGHRLYAATVGDSRLYLLRGRAIIQLSTDHTWIQEALERGFIQPEEVRGHPNAHVIRRYLGSPSPPRVDIRLRLSSRESDTQSEANQGVLLQAGDQLILCSDGLTDLVENREILNAFTSQPAQKAAEAMVNLANARGGHDNITLVAIDVPSIPAAEVVPAGRQVWRRGCAVVLVLLLAALTVGGFWYMRTTGILGGSPTAAAASPTVTQTAGGATAAAPTATQVGPTTPAPEIIRSPVPSATPTRSYLAPGESTLTPWPTNTPAR